MVILDIVLCVCVFFFNGEAEVAKSFTQLISIQDPIFCIINHRHLAPCPGSGFHRCPAEAGPQGLYPLQGGWMADVCPSKDRT